MCRGVGSLDASVGGSATAEIRFGRVPRFTPARRKSLPRALDEGTVAVVEPISGIFQLDG